MALTNKQINTLLNQAFTMFTGADEISSLSTEGIIDTGKDTLTSSKEKFTGALVNVIIKNWFTDSSYRSQFKDDFFEDASQYGAIMQTISVEMPEAIANPAWNDFISAYDNPSTATRLHDTPIYIPIVSTKFYESSDSWAIPVTVTDAQWDTAVRNAEELTQFTAYIFMVVDNAIVCHLENMNSINRNNFMANKIDYASGSGATGIHVINLVELAYKEGAVTADAGETITANAFLNDKLAMLFSTEKMRLFKSYFGKFSKLFNTEDKTRFTPDDRLVLQVNSAFNEKLATVAMSNTFHDDLVKLPHFSVVPAWQGLGTSLSWEDVTKIDVKLSDSKTVTKSGIVAFMCDKWAIMHTTKSRKTGVDRDDIKELTLYVNKFRDAYYNDLSMNALIFTVEDYTVPQD